MTSATDVLRMIAASLEQWPAPDDLVARLAGDEFAIAYRAAGDELRRSRETGRSDCCAP